MSEFKVASEKPYIPIIIFICVRVYMQVQLPCVSKFVFVCVCVENRILAAESSTQQQNTKLKCVLYMNLRKT